MAIDWTEERVRLLNSLWIAVPQISTRDIGILCQRQFGEEVSKNAVIGKCHRFAAVDPFAWPARPSPIVRRHADAPPPPPPAQSVSAPTLPPLPTQAALPPVMLPLAATSRLPVSPQPKPLPTARPVAATSMLIQPPRPAEPVYRRPPTACCWPIGEPRKPDFRFCGDPSLSGKPYCLEHAKIAFVRVPRPIEETAGVAAAARA